MGPSNEGPSRTVRGVPLQTFDILVQEEWRCRRNEDSMNQKHRKLKLRANEDLSSHLVRKVYHPSGDFTPQSSSHLVDGNIGIESNHRKVSIALSASRIRKGVSTCCGKWETLKSHTLCEFASFRKYLESSRRMLETMTNLQFQESKNSEVDQEGEEEKEREREGGGDEEGDDEEQEGEEGGDCVDVGATRTGIQLNDGIFKEGYFEPVPHVENRDTILEGNQRNNKDNNICCDEDHNYGDVSLDKFNEEHADRSETEVVFDTSTSSLNCPSTSKKLFFQALVPVITKYINMMKNQMNDVFQTHDKEAKLINKSCHLKGLLNVSTVRELSLHREKIENNLFYSKEVESVLTFCTNSLEQSMSEVNPELVSKIKKMRKKRLNELYKSNIHKQKDIQQRSTHVLCENNEKLTFMHDEATERMELASRMKGDSRQCMLQLLDCIERNILKEVSDALR